MQRNHTKIRGRQVHRAVSKRTKKGREIQLLGRAQSGEYYALEVLQLKGDEEPEVLSKAIEALLDPQQ